MTVSAAKVQSVVTLPYYAKILDSYVTPKSGTLADEETRRGAVSFESDFVVEAAQRALESPLRRRKVSDPDDLTRGQLSPDPDDMKRNWLNWSATRWLADTVSTYLPKTGKQVIDRTLRDVGVYLNSSAAAAAVNKEVKGAFEQVAPPVVVVAHSLGTIVAYNVLQGLKQPVVLLMTVGSPLGVKAVARRLKRPIKWPGCVERWVNACDPRDIVSLNYPLNRLTLFASASNDSAELKSLVVNHVDVDNFTNNRHSIDGYLSDPFVAREILTALKSG